MSEENDVIDDEFSPSEEEVEAYFKAEGDYEFGKTEKTEAETTEDGGQEEGEVRQEGEKEESGRKPGEAEERAKVQLSDLEAKIAKMEEALRVAQHPQAKEPEKDDKKEEDIDYEEFPLTYLKKKLEALETNLKETVDRQTLVAEYQNIAAKCADQVKTFEAEHPDYAQAYSYIKAQQYNEFLALGLTDHEARKRLNTLDYELATTSLKKGENSAKTIYGLAVARGYKAPAKEVKADKKDESASKGRKVAKSLSGVGSNAVDGEGATSLEKLLMIDDPAEFDKAWTKYLKEEGIYE